MGRVVLECNNICKKFKNKVILDDVSFKLCEGDIVGLIGKNKKIINFELIIYFLMTYKTHIFPLHHFLI